MNIIVHKLLKRKGNSNMQKLTKRENLDVRSLKYVKASL